MEFFAQLTTDIPQNLLDLIKILGFIILVLFLLLTAAIGYFLGSRRYKFRRDWRSLDVTVTRYLIGLLPIYRKTYKNITHIHLEDFLYRNDSDPIECAQIFAHLKSGKVIPLKKMFIYDNKSAIQHTADKIEALLGSMKPQVFIIHNCRAQSFLLSLFGYILGTSAIISLLWIGGSLGLSLFGSAINDYLSQQDSSAYNETYESPIDILYSADNLPDSLAVDDASVNGVPVNNLPVNNLPVDNLPVDDFPIIDNTVIIKIERNNQTDEHSVWLQTAHYDSLALAIAIRDALHDLGWETSPFTEFPSYDIDGNLRPESGHMFYLRHSAHTLEGHVMTHKSQKAWSAVISLPIATPSPTPD